MLINSPFPDVGIPDSAVAPFVLERAQSLGANPALIDGATGRAVTYAQLDDQVRRMAAGLIARGFVRGDRLALLAPNIPEFVVTFLATTLAGGAVTTINPVYNAAEIEHQLRDAQPRLLVTVPAALERASQAVRATGVGEIAVIGEQSFAAFQHSGYLADQVAVDPGDDVAALPYSSGTTASPKGVMLTHRNLVANLCQADGLMPLSPREVVLGVLPFFHIYGMTIIMNMTLRGGGTIVTMPRFDLEAFLKAIDEYRVTRAYVVPPIVLALAKHPLVDDYELSSLSLLNSGAAPLGAELEVACAERLGCRVSQGYGMTEASPVTHGTAVPDGPVKPGTVGVPAPNVECRIVSVETGEDAGPGERGELWVRGPNVMKGYLNNLEATRVTIDDDGWLRTGDVAIVDDESCFTIVDRMKELIKYKAFQVAPAELEALLITHPLVADVAVVPVPDEEAGELPKAYVVAAGEVTEAELRAYVAERVSSYKQIRVVEFVEQIPKSPSGKILRRVLKDRARTGLGQL